ncbi:hypothetical protein SETIT_8G057300v2 [Setaria italica]|uniref:Uncharacterized protein n=1 Tax=Setaria italica TaxID=4555 RepID=A0A368S690_SETIT|nr:hypothetical protein SETIT_8G057300v2 [Setaria italica]
MRAQSDAWFADYLLRIGNGVEETIGDDYVQLLDDILIDSPIDNIFIDTLIDQVFPNLHVNCTFANYMRERAILSTRNEHVDAMNALMIDRFLGFQKNCIDAEIVNGQHAGKRVFIPRIPMLPSEDLSLPFKFKRKEFPIWLSFAMTIINVQGQTIPNLYVVLSKGVSCETTWVLARKNKDMDLSGKGKKNIVYRDVSES